MSRRIVLVAWLCLVLGARAPAQDAPTILASGSSAGLVGLGEVEGWPVGGSESYKVCFKPGGAEFVPALGADWPHNMPVRLQLISVSRGEQTLVSADGRARPQADADGASVSLRHGPGLVERWELRPPGAELSFAFDEVPAGSGDLVVRMRLTTELQAQDDGASDGLSLLAQSPTGSTGGVHIGGVEGVDGAGRRAPGSLRLSGDVLELSLPDAFLREATGPLVLDPLVGPVHSFGSSPYVKNSACASYDPTTLRYLVVWQRLFSATDGDVHGVLVSADGAPIGNLIYLDNTTQNDWDPQVAYVRLRQRFLVAWQRIGTSYRGVTVHPADGSLGPQVSLATIHGPGPGGMPALAGNATLANDRGLLAFVDNEHVWIASVSVPPSGKPEVDVMTQVDGSALSAIGLSRSGGAPNGFLLAWVSLTKGLRVAMFNAFAGTIIGPDSPYVPAGYQVYDPHVDGDGTRFAVSYLQYNPTTGQQDELWKVRVQYDGPAFKLGPTMGSTEEHWQTSSVAWNGLSFQLAATPFGVPTGPPPGLYIGGIAPDAFVYTDPFVKVGPDIYMTQITSPTASNTLPAETGLVVGKSVGTPSFTWWRTVQSHGAGGEAVSLGGGCGVGGGQLFALGTPALANPNFLILLLGANPLANTIYLNLDFTSTVVSCGPCTFAPLGIVVALPAVGGAAAVSLPLSAEPAWKGFTAYVQGIIPTPGVSPCSSLKGVSFTNRLKIVLE